MMPGTKRVLHFLIGALSSAVGLACEGDFATDPGGTGGSDVGTGASANGTGGASGGSTSSGGVQETGGGANASGGAPHPGFPITEIRDDFEAGSLSEFWDSNVSSFFVESGVLACSSGNDCSTALLSTDSFPVTQEVYATSAGISDTAEEVNLVLLANGLDCELVEASYLADTQEVAVFVCAEGSWETLVRFSAPFVTGQRFGARILEGRSMQIFRDDELLDTVDLAGFPYDSGRIGVSGLSGSGTIAFDDFGGGAY